MTQAIISTGFNGVNFDVIDHDNQTWLKGSQIGAALGYKDPAKKIHELYTRHAEEFTESMTQVIEITDTPTLGGQLTTKVRVFSLRGCHLLAMFARTPVAKAFRVWVLDILERMNKPAQPTPIALPRLSLPSDPERKALNKLVKVWGGMLGAEARIWPVINTQVAAYVGVTTVDNMTIAQVRDAIKFVQGKIDVMQNAQTLTAPQPALPAIPDTRSRDRDISTLGEELRRLMWKAGDISRDLHTVMNTYARTMGLGSKKYSEEKFWLMNTLHKSNESAFYALDYLAESIELNVRAMRSLAKM